MTLDTSRKLPPGSIVCIATWRLAPGSVDAVLAALGPLAEASRMEPGNLLYQPLVAGSDAEVVRILEVYVDQNALAAHSQSAHFVRFGVDQAFPLLLSRSREVAVAL